MFSINRFTTPSVSTEDVSKSGRSERNRSGSGQPDPAGNSGKTGVRHVGGAQLDALLHLPPEPHPVRRRYSDADGFVGAALDPYADSATQSQRENDLAPALTRECLHATFALPTQFRRNHKHLDNALQHDPKSSLTPPAPPQTRLRRLSEGLVDAATQLLPAVLVPETQDEMHRRIALVNTHRREIDNKDAQNRLARSTSQLEPPR